jgi:hypothetical protein
MLHAARPAGGTSLSLQMEWTGRTVCTAHNLTLTLRWVERVLTVAATLGALLYGAPYQTEVCKPPLPLLLDPMIAWVDASVRVIQQHASRVLPP